MMTDIEFEKLISERRQLMKLTKNHVPHPKMVLVVEELKKAICEIELKLLALVPPSIDQEIRDAQFAPIVHTKKKPNAFDKRITLGLYKHKRFVCVRAQSDRLYPNNVRHD